MRTVRIARPARLRIAAGSLALVTALTLTGCSNPFQDALDGLIGSQVPEGTEEILKQVTDGAISGEVPDDFPSGIPLPDAPLLNAGSYTEDDSTGWLLQYQETGAIVDLDALGEQLLAQGYVEDGEMAWTEQMQLKMYKNADYMVTLSGLGDEGERIIQVMVVKLR